MRLSIPKECIRIVNIDYPECTQHSIRHGDEIQIPIPDEITPELFKKLLLEALELQQRIELEIQQGEEFIQQMEEFDQKQRAKISQGALQLNSVTLVHTKTLLSKLQQIVKGESN